MKITGIRLTRVQDHAVVFIEVEDEWIELIRERAEGAFDHIVNESGIVASVGRSGDVNLEKPTP